MKTADEIRSIPTYSRRPLSLNDKFLLIQLERKIIRAQKSGLNTLVVKYPYNNHRIARELRRRGFECTYEGNSYPYLEISWRKYHEL